MLSTKIMRFITAVAAAFILLVGAIVFGFNLKEAIAGGLPPRPEPPPSSPNPATLEGGAIILELSGAATGPAGVWTVVEWQDPYTEEWHTVDGWQGTVETDGSQKWWVGTSDFATGPFRWVIYDSENGPLLGVSETFVLPEENGQNVVVVVDL